MFYRLNVVRIHLPPLRERREDIRLLVNYFLQQFTKSRAIPGKVTKISTEALKILDKSPWPGNVRELENVIERAAVVARGDSILPKDTAFRGARSALDDCAAGRSGLCY